MGCEIRKFTMFLAASAMAVVAACGTEKQDAEAIGKALAVEQKGPSIDDKAIEDRRKERESKEAARAAAEAEKKAKIDALTELPERLPKDVKRACKDVGDALEGFMKRHLADDPATLEKWQSAKSSQLSVTIQGCTRSGSLQAAACQKHALDHAPAEFKEIYTELILACNDKYASQTPAIRP